MCFNNISNNNWFDNDCDRKFSNDNFDDCFDKKFFQNDCYNNRRNEERNDWSKENLNDCGRENHNRPCCKCCLVKCCAGNWNVEKKCPERKPMCNRCCFCMNFRNNCWCK